MSPASKTKSKDKKAGKDPQKASVKPPSLVSMTSGGAPVSGYNPVLGKFHAIDTAPHPSIQLNGRFRNIDENDDNSGSSNGNAMEFDTLSNNGSWSGESEDPKDKNNIIRQEAVPGAADTEKREKMRQKNEKKHQRQKERRAQELHERCNGFLMSRKLEALARQLVSMGFTQEQATMALISNEGKIEESVTWLFEASEDMSRKENLSLDSGNIKIDISDELARIAEMEIRYKFSKQEVERAIVACEGDLEKAADILRLQKQESLSSPKPGETGDLPTPINEKLSLSNSQNPVQKIQPKPIPPTLLQQKRDDKSFNYTKATNGTVVAIEPAIKNMPDLRKTPSKPQQIVTPVDKQRWSAAATNPSVSYSLSSPLHVTPPPVKPETLYTALGNELNNLQIKEPVIVMQRPQSANGKQVPFSSISSSPSNPAANWYPNNVEILKPNGLLNGLPNGPNTRSLGSYNNMSSSNQFYSNLLYQQPQQLQQLQQYPQYSHGMVDYPGVNRGNNGIYINNRMTGLSPTVAVASSLGLFTGMGSNGSSGSSSPVDWKTGGSMVELDYANIDWSLDRSSKPNLWMPNNNSSINNNNSSRTISMRNSAISNGMQDSGGVAAASSSSSGETTSAGGEWSSPFEEKDIFSLPRQFVFSPSL